MKPTKDEPVQISEFVPLVEEGLPELSVTLWQNKGCEYYFLCCNMKKM